MTNMVTQRQIDFIAKLATEREMSDPTEHVLKLTSKEASQFIDYLKTIPKPQSTGKARVEIEDGMYVLDGEIFKVQHAVHGSGRQYAKRLVPGAEYGERATFEYARGIVYRLTPEHRMTMEQAKEFGAMYGTCVRCGATLTAEDSIDRMMGPVCAGKL